MGKAAKTCSGCGRQVDSGAGRCPHCKQAFVICPGCGQEVAERIKFCSYCGGKMPEEKTYAGAEEPAAGERPVKTAAEIQGTDPGVSQSAGPPTTVVHPDESGEQQENEEPKNFIGAFLAGMFFQKYGCGCISTLFFLFMLIVILAALAASTRGCF